MFTKIIWAMALVCVAVLGWMLLAEQKRANYLENYIRTQNARNARHGKKDEPETELEQKFEEEKLIEQHEQN